MPEKHIWNWYIHEHGLMKGTKSRNIKFCIKCKIQAKQVVAGIRYEFPNGAFEIDKRPECKPVRKKKVELPEEFVIRVPSLNK